MQPYISKISKAGNCNKLFICLFLLPLLGCSDFFEEDLSDKSVSLRYPINSETIEEFGVQFDWDELLGATSYKIEVVNDSFVESSITVFDSTLASTSVTATLVSGWYEWQVTAYNVGSSSITSKARFFIDSSLDLSLQTVTLIAPGQDSILKQTQTPNFSWNEIPIADEYIIAVKVGANFTGQEIEYQIIDVGTTYTSSEIYAEGIYTWGIQAKNSLPTESDWSTHRFIVDTTRPTTPTLTDVSTVDTIASGSSYIIAWTQPADQGVQQTSRVDSLVIYSDSLTTSIFELKQSNQTHTYTFTSAGSYFWRVKSIDEACNQGSFSVPKKLVVE